MVTPNELRERMKNADKAFADEVDRFIGTVETEMIKRATGGSRFATIETEPSGVRTEAARRLRNIGYGVSEYERGIEVSWA